jgi:hypothetical protein
VQIIETNSATPKRYAPRKREEETYGNMEVITIAKMFFTFSIECNYAYLVSLLIANLRNNTELIMLSVL